MSAPAWAQTKPNGASAGDDWEPTDDDAPDAPPRKSGPAPKPDPFADRWVQLADRPELLIDAPPKQVWLLDRYVEQRTVGVLPRGRTGLLTATGGLGKTYAAVQLAVAVASGGFWLDTFRVATPGHVLLALAEEDIDEAQRRLWRACNAAELSAEQRRQVAARIDLLPLYGVSVALTYSPAPGVVVASEIATALRERLERRGVDWALIVLDPLSRWAAGGVESDNESATRFAQVLEALRSVPGSPTLLVNHHSSKASTRDGDSDARGVTGIRDAFRWQVSLDGLRSEDGKRAVRLRNKKSNYSPEFDDLILVRNQERGIEGTLRVATAAEAAPFGMTTEQARDEKRDDRARERVVRDAVAVARILEAQPGIGGRELRAAMRAQTGAGHERTDAALAYLGSAVERATGARGARPMRLVTDHLPDDVRAALKESQS